ncbi:cytochrome P450 3A11-like [Watersipora subatra]|uniref:cytochrome P450 3A11-like n=1 Tax=Watersipora subatra TaxID=2589382 RepID=UPI00355C78CA
MLVFGIDIPVWLTLVFIACGLLYWYGTSTFDTFDKMGLPYPKPLPFIGNTAQMMSMPIHDYEVCVLKKLSSKVHGSFQGRLPVIDVADAEFAKQVCIKEFSSFTNRRDPLQRDDDMGASLLLIKDDHWKHVRSTLTPTFTSGKLKQMHGVITDCADRFMEYIHKTSSAPFGIKAYCEAYTMDVIARTAFGMEIDVQGSTNHPFVQHARTFFGIPNTRSKFMQQLIVLSVVFLPKRIKLFLGLFVDMSFVERESSEYFKDVIDKILLETQSKASERKDFISTCAEKIVDTGKAEKETLRQTDGRTWSTQGLTRSDVIANSFTFFSAGYETTASTMQFFFYSMATHPSVQQRLYEEISEVVTESGEASYEQLKGLEYLDWCINETLRVFPAIVRVDRVASRDVTINGLDIPKGMIVNILIHAIHHDPEYWPEPDKYDPERFSPHNLTETQKYAFLGFGSGNRSCIASRLALLELRIAIVKLLTAFRFEVAPDTPKQDNLQYENALGIMQPKVPIQLRAIPRAI